MSDLTELPHGLIESDPYSDEDYRKVDKYSAEEWAYERGFEETSSLFTEMAPNDIIHDIGQLFVNEGEDAARTLLNEEVGQTISIMSDERFLFEHDIIRQYAGYKLDDGGRTVEEGDYGTVEDLVVALDAGIRDALLGNCKYDSLPERI